MLPQTEIGLPSAASVPAAAAIAALTQDRALIGLLRGTVDPANELIIVNSEYDLAPHLSTRSIAAALIDSMFVEGDLAALAERLREQYPELVLVVVGTAEEQSRVASQITSGVVYRFLHRPVSAPRVRLFVDAALRRHEVETVEHTLEQQRPDFSKFEAANKPHSGGDQHARVAKLAVAALLIIVTAGGGYALWSNARDSAAPVAAATDTASAYRPAASQPASEPVSTPASEPVSAAALEPAPIAEVAPEDSIAEPLPAPVPVAPPPPTREERLREQLKLAEAALQRTELVTPAGASAADHFQAALAIDASNTLAKAGVVRVADSLLAAAEKAVTDGNVDEARRLLAHAERLSPATARGAFVRMQIDKERERTALTRARESSELDKIEKGHTYLRLANTRLRSGDLIEPSEDNARFYIEAARALVPDDPALSTTSRALQTELLGRASTAAAAGNAADAERWLANAEGAGAGSADLAPIRRVLQENLVAARAARITMLTRSFSAALAAGQLVEPQGASAKSYLLALVEADASHPAARDARQSLGTELLKEVRIATARSDLVNAERWLGEVRAIAFDGSEARSAELDLAAARAALAQRNSVIGANSLERIEYVEPKFPPIVRKRDLRELTGWVELEFTILTDGATGDVVVTNSQPKRTFDAAAVAAVSEWRYRPVVRDGKPVEQRARVRIRFADK